jgi:hypothetical protein
MFGSVVLDVAIGMVFVFLLLSLIASVVQEMLAAFMQLRPANLLRGLCSLFSGDSLWGKDLVDSIYGHGLTRGLFADPYRDLQRQATGGSADPAANLNTGQAVEKASTEKRPDLTGPSKKQPEVIHEFPYSRPLDPLRHWLRKVIGITPEKEVSVVTNQLLLPAYIPSRTFALAMIDILNQERASGEDVMKSITESLAKHQAQFADNKAGEALYTLAVTAKGDIDVFQKHLENWYNDAMDRVSGWYKRYTQRVLLCVGLLLAVAFNVSSVRVAQTLWFDRDARTAMANAADEYMKAHPNAPKDANAAKDATAADAATGNPQEDKSSNGADLEKKLEESAEAFNRVTGTALLPVGWAHMRSDWHRIWSDLENLISFGAPFWFDMLNKVMVVRSTIKPQEKSQPEGSKDKPVASKA